MFVSSSSEKYSTRLAAGRFGRGALVVQLTLMAPMLSRYVCTRPIALTSPQSFNPLRALVFVRYRGRHRLHAASIVFRIFRYRSSVLDALPINHSRLFFISSSSA